MPYIYSKPCQSIYSANNQIFDIFKKTGNCKEILQMV